MEANIYDKMAQLENEHWWFVARRDIIRRVIQKHVLQSSNRSDVLDIGCGSGGNLQLLKSLFSTVTGMELDEKTAKLAQEHHNVPIIVSGLPDLAPFKDTSLSVVAMFDVLEHIDDEIQSLKALRAKLNPNGRLILTVPAFNFLWSSHDVSHHHRRRYTKPELLSMLEEAGFKVTYSSYFNTLLFPAIAGIRLLKTRFMGQTANDDLNKVPNWLNTILKVIMSSEAWIMDYINLPFGTSIIAVAQKR